MKLRGIGVAGIVVILLVAGWIAWRSERGPAGAAATGQIAGSAASTPGGVEGENTPGSARASATPQAAASVSPIVGGATPSPADVALAGQGVGAPGQQAPSADKNGHALAMVELQKVHHMVGSYHTLMGQNPVGTNAEIMKALMGGNPRQAMLGPPPGQSLNAKGELVDPWGTPYFFHQLSGDDMEIHSAGPDKTMGTADDLVIP
jgi:hypothetical protein